MVFNLYFVFNFCRDNQIDKHLRNKTLQCIINEELKGNHILWYDKTFSEEKEAFEETKICVIICLFLIVVFLVFIFFRKSYDIDLVELLIQLLLSKRN
jgi:hypothetical protein